jgi:sugar phosphate isomerase/epimerase
MSAEYEARLTRREFLGAAGALAGASALTRSADAASTPGETPMSHPLSPAVNPIFLTASATGWPLAELALAGYRGLEITPDALDTMRNWKASAEKAGLRPVCVNALSELRPYLTGSLSDGVEWRRRATLDRLKILLARMREASIEFMVVAPSRLAENYQSPAQARALLVESLRELSDTGGAIILLESAPFRLFASAGEIASIVDEVKRPNVAAALDTGHALLSGEDPAEAARALGPRLRYVQVNDADTHAGIPRLDRHLPPGRGALVAASVRSAVGDLPFCVNITAPAAPVEAARAALQWVIG